MPFATEYENCGTHLRIGVSGPFTRESMFALIDAVKAEAERVGMKRVLIDGREIGGIPSDMDRFASGERAAEVWAGWIKVAAVFPPSHVNKLGENAAVNRGARLLIDTSIDAALAWLLSKQDDGWIV